MSYTVGKYETKKCVKWEVRYRTPGGRTTRKRGFLRKMDAEAWAAETWRSPRPRAQLHHAKRRGTLQWRNCGQSWTETKRTRCKPSYMESLGGAWNKHVGPQWGARKVGSIRHDEVQEWVNKLAGEYSASVVIRARDMLKGLLKAAVKNRLIASNPADDITVPRKKRKDHVYLTAEQLMGFGRRGRVASGRPCSPWARLECAGVNSSACGCVTSMPKDTGSGSNATPSRSKGRL